LNFETSSLARLFFYGSSPGSFAEKFIIPSVSEVKGQQSPHTEKKKSTKRKSSSHV
jgi:hypothetical protein